jgi:phosphopantothenoylcysteine decarboxylase / phosphopantothenate---cysteine ligase
MSSNGHIVLGVTGGIAAYKSVDIARRLTEAGLAVTVVPTAEALQFVGAATFEAITGRRVLTDPFDDPTTVPHVSLGREADLVLVAPATADFLARTVLGRSDDLLGSLMLTTRAPVIVAPAMHTEMWEHPATRANVGTLRERGLVIVDPAVGRLTGEDSGAGRLPEPAELTEIALTVLAMGAPPRDLDGRRILVTAGGTREPIDPVRFIGNRSSGKQGMALAQAARLRGADVHLIAANLPGPFPAAVTCTHVATAAELAEEVLASLADIDILIMAAAVADFAPVAAAAGKIKKSDGPPLIELTPTIDILATIGRQRRQHLTLVGFAAETDDLLGNATAKVRSKGADLIVANDVSGGATFGADTNEVTILGVNGVVARVERASKALIAHAVLDAVAGLGR